MKRFSFRLSIALLTLLFSFGFTFLWHLYSYIPRITNDEIEGLERINSNCYLPVPEELQISKKDKRFWNKHILKRFNERPLEKLFPVQANESYRFVLFPTFDAPVAVRIYKSNEGYFLIAKQLSGQGGFGIKKFGKLASVKTKNLTENEWQKFQNLIDRLSFWAMSPLAYEDPVDDGATWIMEGNYRGTYTEIHRITPRENFRESCIYLLKLAGFEDQYSGYWQTSSDNPNYE